jgi:hypothetical protein
MESIFKMAILHLSTHLFQHCIYAIFKSTIFKFGYIRINESAQFFDPLSGTPDIELGL